MFLPWLLFCLVLEDPRAMYVVLLLKGSFLHMYAISWSIGVLGKSQDCQSITQSGSKSQYRPSQDILPHVSSQLQQQDQVQVIVEQISFLINLPYRHSERETCVHMITR